MSRLIEEDEDYLYIEDYLHGYNDSYAAWELDAEGNEKYADYVHQAQHTALYEFQIKYRIGKNTGEVIYLEFDGMELPN